MYSLPGIIPVVEWKRMARQFLLFGPRALPGTRYWWWRPGTHLLRTWLCLLFCFSCLRHRARKIVFALHGVSSFVSAPNVFVVVVAALGSHAAPVRWLLIVFSATHVDCCCYLSLVAKFFLLHFPILFHQQHDATPQHHLCHLVRMAAVHHRCNHNIFSVVYSFFPSFYIFFFMPTDAMTNIMPLSVAWTVWWIERRRRHNKVRVKMALLSLLVPFLTFDFFFPLFPFLRIAWNMSSFCG